MQPQQEMLTPSEINHLKSKAHLACQLLNGQRLIIDNLRRRVKELEQQLDAQ